MSRTGSWGRRRRVRAGRLLAWLLFVASSLFAGCQRYGHIDSANAPDKPRVRRLTSADIASLLREAAALRGLPSSDAIPIIAVDAQGAPRGVHRVSRASAAPVSSRADSQFALAFGVLPRQETLVDDLRARLGSGPAVYDPVRRAILFETTVFADDDELATAYFIAAHAAGSALLDRAYSPSSEERADLDEQLARAAFLEGDAMSLAVATLAAREGVPARRALRIFRDRMSDGAEPTKPQDLWSQARRTRATPGVALALDQDDARESFFVLDGTWLVGDALRTGGYELVDKAYSAMPRSSAEVLHPDRFLAGAPRVQLGAWTPPASVAVTSQGTLGELELGILLRRCLGERARDTVSAWAADRYYTVETPQDGESGAALVSTWLEEAAARELESKLASPACFPARADAGLPAGFTVRRKGNTVVAVRGFSRGAEALLASLLAIRATNEPRPVLTTKPIPERRPMPAPSATHVDEGNLENAWLGITAAVPAPMHAAPEQEGWGVTVRAEDALGRFFVVPASFDPKVVLDRVADEIVARADRENVGFYVVDGPIETALGPGIAREWRIRSGGGMRVAVVPICESSGALVFVTAYRGASSRAALDAWVASFQRRVESPPACAYLNPP
ncbi:MAG: hypothetical protein U0271_30295 [Polyangiaceae bacterium]